MTSVYDDLPKIDALKVCGMTDKTATFEMDTLDLVDYVPEVEIETFNVLDTNMMKINVRIVMKPIEEARPDGLINIFERKQ